MSFSKFSFLKSRQFVVRCAIWYHLYNLKNVKNTHGGVLILVKLQASIYLRSVEKSTCLRVPQKIRRIFIY